MGKGYGGLLLVTSKAPTSCWHNFASSFVFSVVPAHPLIVVPGDYLHSVFLIGRLRGDILDYAVDLSSRLHAWIVCATTCILGRRNKTWSHQKFNFDVHLLRP